MRVRSNFRGFPLILLRNIICIFIVLLILICFADSRIKPITQKISVQQGKQKATAIINDSVYDTLKYNNSTYENFATIVYNNNGDIASIQVLSASINLFQSEVTDRIIQKSSQNKYTVAKIPMGNLTGVQLFSGRGPNFNVRILPSSSIKTSIISEFKSAGVNQTCHSIYMEVTMDYTSIIMPHKVESDTTVKLCIAECIIVGEIPDSYTYIDVGDSILPEVLDEKMN